MLYLLQDVTGILSIDILYELKISPAAMVTSNTPLALQPLFKITLSVHFQSVANWT